MARAIDVAIYLIQLAAAEDEPEFLTHLRLQKLLYYVQGWSLAQRDVPMFPERIEAWAHGPVVPAVWQQFRDFGGAVISPETVSLDENTIDDEEGAYIASVWEVYKPHSALSLRAMTHRERPWVDAHAGYSPGEMCNVEITQDALRSFFTELDRQ